MNFIYSLIYSLCLTFLFPLEYFRRPKSLRSYWIKEKFGYITQPLINDVKKNLWIHAVSVGEILAIYPLVKSLSAEYNIFLTTITDTGKAVAQKRFENLVAGVYYLPFDLQPFLKRFIETINPCALLIVETEIWPNLIDVASKKIPVILINGRISEKSFKRYLKAKWFFKRYLNKFSLLLVQEEKYKEYFLKLGVNEEKIIVTGNLKFDLIVEKRDFPELESLPRPFVVLGSSHEPEEVTIAKIFLELDLNGTLIIVPRHPERFATVEVHLRSLASDKATFFRYSDLSQKIRLSNLIPESISKRVILLFDKMGLLGSLYGVCDVAIIGGSFIPHGGQNPLEAIYWKKPVITGPYMSNFPFVEEFWREGGILKTTEQNLGEVLKSLLRDREFSESVSKTGYTLFLKMQGATEKTLEQLKRLIPLSYSN